MIDAHVHVWRLGRNGCTWPPADLAPIHRDFALDDLQPIAAAAGVDGVLLVQSQEDVADTQWLLELAAANPLVRGVIGWADLRSGPPPLPLGGPLKGLRIMAQDRPADHLGDPALGGALCALADASLVIDLLVRPQHLAAADTLAGAHPSLSIVIDHCAKPVLTEDGMADWRERLAPLASRPNVWCKLSGLLTEREPGHSDEPVRTCIAAALALFGAERLIWGSDWPVLTLADDYPGWLALARAEIPARDHAAVFGGNAARCYGLGG